MLCIKWLRNSYPTLDATLEATLPANKVRLLPLPPALLFDDTRLRLIDTRLRLTVTRLFSFEFSREFEQKKAPKLKLLAL